MHEASTRTRDRLWPFRQGECVVELQVLQCWQGGKGQAVRDYKLEIHKGMPIYTIERGKVEAGAPIRDHRPLSLTPLSHMAEPSATSSKQSGVTLRQEGDAAIEAHSDCATVCSDLRRTLEEL